MANKKHISSLILIKIYTNSLIANTMLVVVRTRVAVCRKIIRWISINLKTIMSNSLNSNNIHLNIICTIMKMQVIKIMDIIMIGRIMVDRITMIDNTIDRIIDRIIDKIINIVNMNMGDKTIKRIGIVGIISNNKIISIISIENNNMSISYKVCRKY
jgi:hypothetical protein